MQVILIEEVPNLGSIGEQVNVKPGYARNFLLPRKMAIAASVKNQRRLEHEKKVASFRLVQAKAKAMEAVKALADKSLTIARKVGEQDKLFGSVTAGDIALALVGVGVTIDRRKIQLREPIKALGDYNVPVKLAGDVLASIKVSVVAE